MPCLTCQGFSFCLFTITLQKGSYGSVAVSVWLSSIAGGGLWPLCKRKPNDCTEALCLMQTFLGDVLSDLPEVSTFSTADRTMYATEPQTPMQLYLRRNPLSWAASREHRARLAAAMMADTREDLAFKMQSLAMLPNPAAMVRGSGGSPSQAPHLGYCRHMQDSVIAAAG